MYKKGIKERGSKGMGKRRLCFHVFDRTVYRIFCKVTPIFSDDKESINNYISDFLKGQRVGKKRGRRKYTPWETMKDQCMTYYLQYVIH